MNFTTYIFISNKCNRKFQLRFHALFAENPLRNFVLLEVFVLNSFRSSEYFFLKNKSNFHQQNFKIKFLVECHRKLRVLPVKYECRYCARTYQMEGTYRRHFISHFDCRHFACEICDTVSKTYKFDQFCPKIHFLCLKKNVVRIHRCW